MDLPEICLTTGIKVLLGTWVGIKVSQRIYKMYSYLRSKRTSKFSSGKIKKDKRQSSKSFQVWPLRRSNINSEPFSVLEDNIEGNKNFDSLFKNLAKGMTGKEEREVHSSMDFKDNAYLNEMDLCKDIVKTRENLLNGMENTNNTDKLEDLCSNMKVRESGEDSNIKMEEVELIKESPQNLTDIDMGDQKSDKVKSSDIENKRKLCRNESKTMSVLIRIKRGEMVDHDINIARVAKFNANKEKPPKRRSSPLNCITLVKTETPLHNVLVNHDLYDKELIQKVYNEKDHFKEFSKSILQEPKKNHFIKGQNKKAMVFLKKIKITDMPKGTGNVGILLNGGFLGRMGYENRLDIINDIPSLLCAKRIKVAINVDPLPNCMIENFNERENIKSKRKSTGTVEKSVITSGGVLKSLKSEPVIEDNSVRINGDDYPALQGWTKYASLCELDAVDFGTVTGLSTLEEADNKRKKTNAPRPLVRLIRSRYRINSPARKY